MKVTYSAEIEAIRTKDGFSKPVVALGKYDHHPWHALSAKLGCGAGR
jgi:hypothetical protein